MFKIENFDKIIIANWKLNGSLPFVEKYINKIKFDHLSEKQKCVIICPPHTLISHIKSSNLLIGSQDCSIFSEGAYTGEISIKMLKEIGCDFCIVGHSERRNLFKETDEIVLQKAKQCLNEYIIPILCIGENFQQKKR